MRLLKRLQSDGGFQLETFDDDDPPEYAVLSHTWVGEEVTYHDFVESSGNNKAGYQKIRFCGDQTAKDGLEYFWIDSCCIDQSNTHELSTAINSMFRWYQRASRCYVYLSDVEVPEDLEPEACPTAWLDAFQKSRWFTRGWTLQELLAPVTVNFYCKQGKLLGSRISLEQEICQITGIATSALRGRDLTEFSIEERMSWTAGRETTVKEDKIYCLLGIFNVFLPLIYGEGEDYATTRLREEIQRRHEGRGADISKNMPEQLRTLETSLQHPKTHSRMTIHGLGGCGKSALAIEFAYRTLSKHARPIFWVPAISRDSFELAYRDIGIRLRIPCITDDNADVKKLVRATLDSADSGRWLMIVDNADDHDVLSATTTDNNGTLSRLTDFLPRNDKGAILFTTRSRKMAHVLTPGAVLELSTLDSAGTTQLLSRRIINQSLLNDDDSVKELLDLLTYLPLAIVQAAAYINNNDVSVTAYVRMLREANVETELFSEHFIDHSRYEGLDSTVAKIWHTSFDQICKDDPLAAEMLSFSACIERTNIPQSLLARDASLVQQTKALGTLTGYAFLTERQHTTQFSGNDRCFDMHRLVHLASIWWLERCHQRTVWVNMATRHLSQLVPYGDHETKMRWTMYLPHAIHVVEVSTAGHTAASANLLHRVGSCRFALGQYSAAETVYRRALALMGEVAGPQYPCTLWSMNDLGSALVGQGKYAEAEKLLRDTLGLTKDVSGGEHHATLTPTNNLAMALCNQGKLAEAEDVIRESLSLHKEVLGEHYLGTLASMNNLGMILSLQAKYAEAESLHRHMLRLSEESSKEEHPGALACLNNLASVLQMQGLLDQAEVIFVKALSVRRRVLGEEHPDTLITMNNLGQCLADQMRYKEAEQILRKTLKLREKVLGDQHSCILNSMSNLGRVLEKQSRYEEALTLYERAYSRSRKAFGGDHAQTRHALQSWCNTVVLQEKDRRSATRRTEGDSDDESADVEVCKDNTDEEHSVKGYSNEESFNDRGPWDEGLNNDRSSGESLGDKGSEQPPDDGYLGDKGSDLCALSKVRGEKTAVEQVAVECRTDTRRGNEVGLYRSLAHSMRHRHFHGSPSSVRLILKTPSTTHVSFGHWHEPNGSL